MKAIRVHRYGGLEVLRCEEVPIPEPGPGEARVRIEASGVNFIDIYNRTGLYPNALPFTLGMEGAGSVEAVGRDVTELREGDRVAQGQLIGEVGQEGRATGPHLCWRMKWRKRNLDPTLLVGVVAPAV